MASGNDAGAGNVMLAFLLGAVAGAAVALLYAPATGQDTREFLGDKAREGRARADRGRGQGPRGGQPGPRDGGNGHRTGPGSVRPGPHCRAHDRIAERRRVSVWAEVFLGIIALATLAMAIAQIGVLVAAGRLARRVGRLIDQVELELKPVFGHLNAIGRDASRAAALATAQVERVDRLFTDLTATGGRHGPYPLLQAGRSRATSSPRSRRPSAQCAAAPPGARGARKKKRSSSSALRPAPAGW